MARKPTGREYALLVLLGVLSIVAFRFLDSGGLGGGRGEGAAGFPVPEGDPPAILLARLELDAEGYDPAGRNLFKYGPPPGRATPPPKPPPQRPEPPKRQRPKAPERKPTPREPSAPRPRFDYLGYLGPKDARIAVFEDGDDQIHARIGDVVRDEFRLVEFKFDSVVFGYVDDRYKDKTTELSFKR
jgi:hypothetical protein